MQVGSRGLQGNCNTHGTLSQRSCSRASPSQAPQRSSPRQAQTLQASPTTLGWRSTRRPLSRAPTSTTPRRAAAAAGLPLASFGAVEGVRVGPGCGVRGGGLDWEWQCCACCCGPIKLSGCVCSIHAEAISRKLWKRPGLILHILQLASWRRHSHW